MDKAWEHTLKFLEQRRAKSKGMDYACSPRRTITGEERKANSQREKKRKETRMRRLAAL